MRMLIEERAASNAYVRVLRACYLTVYPSEQDRDQARREIEMMTGKGKP